MATALTATSNKTPETGEVGVAKTLFRGMNKEECKHQYKCSSWSSRTLDSEQILQQFCKVTTHESQEAYKTIPCDKDIKYGNRERERLDIFVSDSLPADAPVFVFVHGGYWIHEDYTSYALMVPNLTSAGTVVVVVEYSLAPEVKLEDQVEQVQRAVAYVCEWAKQRGSRGVYVSGHSAGGHLTAMCMTQPHDSYHIIKGVIPMSGIYDVRPITYTSVADTMPLTEEYAWEQSPMKQIKAVIEGCRDKKVLVLLGGDESPEFKRQSHEFNKSLTDGGITSQYVELAGEDHFSLIESMCKRESALSVAVLTFMGLQV
ncbi:kynurenine formamidase-like [Lineus longissimus]|uniref:kynurenine formamidase-like n=1 Tax=Lineus longissimus TaxID=88925 RepID=UPI002B4D8B07